MLFWLFLIILPVIWRVVFSYIIYIVRKRHNYPTNLTVFLGILSYCGTIFFICIALAIAIFKAKAKGLI